MRFEQVFASPLLGDLWSRSLPRWWAGRAVLLGDAAHGLPNNLAQGASVSIEGAHALAAALNVMDERHRTQASPTQTLSCDDVAAAFAAYQATHEPRVRACRDATTFTAALATPTTDGMEAFRNAIRLVPRPLNERIFIASLLYSLGEWPTPVPGGIAPQNDRATP